MAASIITWWVYPLLERRIARVPRDVMNIVFVVVAVFGAIIWSLYIINPPGVDEQNKHPEQAEQIAKQQEAEERARLRDELSNDIGLIGQLSSAMHERVENSTALTDEERQKVLADLDKVTNDLKDIQGVFESDASDGSESASSAAASSESASSSAAASEGASGDAAASGGASGDSAASEGAAEGSAGSESASAAAAA